MELMIVIAVIAILMGLILPSFKGMKDEAQASRVTGDLRTLQTALESFFIHNGNQYPSPDANWQDSLIHAQPQILQKQLFDPFSPEKKPYQYQLKGVYYCIWSVGFNGLGKVTAIDPQSGRMTLAGKPILVTNGDGSFSQIEGN